MNKNTVPAIFSLFTLFIELVFTAMNPSYLWLLNQETKTSGDKTGGQFKFKVPYLPNISFALASIFFAASSGVMLLPNKAWVVSLWSSPNSGGRNWS